MCGRFLFSKSTVIIKGHMNQQRINARSNWMNEEEECDSDKGMV
jgi:hypothetical protein